MDIDTFKAGIVMGNEAEIDELCMQWLYRFAVQCDKQHDARMLEIIADHLGIEITKGQQ